MKAYIRTDPLIDERKGHYTPAQLGAYLMVLCKAARQEPRGRFRSTQALRNMVPASYARLLPFLYDEGDLVVKDDDSVYVDGWDEWQEGDLTVGERMARMRNRKRNGTVTDAVTPTVTEPYRSATSTLTLDVDVDSDVQKEGDIPSPQPPVDAFDTYYRLTMRIAKGGAAQWIGRLIDKYDEALVERAIVHAHRQDTDPSTLLGRVEGLLDQRAFREEKQAEQARKDRAFREMEEQRRKVEDATPEELARVEENKRRVAEMLAAAGKEMA